MSVETRVGLPLEEELLTETIPLQFLEGHRKRFTDGNIPDKLEIYFSPADYNNPKLDASVLHMQSASTLEKDHEGYSVFNGFRIGPGCEFVLWDPTAEGSSNGILILGEGADVIIGRGYKLPDGRPLFPGISSSRSVSRKHLRLQVGGGELVIEDMSMCGTTIEYLTPESKATGWGRRSQSFDYIDWTPLEELKGDSSEGSSGVRVSGLSEKGKTFSESSTLKEAMDILLGGFPESDRDALMMMARFLSDINSLKSDERDSAGRLWGYYNEEYKKLSPEARSVSRDMVDKILSTWRYYENRDSA